jgi:hypothetical protein
MRERGIKEREREREIEKGGERVIYGDREW